MKSFKLVNPLIVGNFNSSFFDIVNKVLSDNNFNFIPLPTFVNFNEPNQLKEMFDPIPWNSTPIIGPSFVCVYAGQSSSNLDLGDNDGVYPDDGIFITVDKNGNLLDIPNDFNTKKTSEDIQFSSYKTNRIKETAISGLFR